MATVAWRKATGQMLCDAIAEIVSQRYRNSKCAFKFR